MKGYSAMSDIEINALVSKELYGPVSRGHQMELANGTVDYCNNPADAWPIIVENNISISHVICRYSSTSLSYNPRHLDDSDDVFKIFTFTGDIGDVSSRAALRSAMIVFLMMKDAEKGHG